MADEYLLNGCKKNLLENTGLAGIGAVAEVMSPINASAEAEICREFHSMKTRQLHHEMFS